MQIFCLNQQLCVYTTAKMTHPISAEKSGHFGEGCKKEGETSFPPVTLNAAVFTDLYERETSSNLRSAVN